MVALLIAGSAILLYSCSNKNDDEGEEETMLTQQSDSLTIVQSAEGRRDFVFKTPLMERYELAREPYMEFRRGVEITTYDDSTGLEASHLVADYAIFFEKRELWEAKGNVVARNAEGQTLYTQQLFWNQSTHRVYSNVDSKVVQGRDVFIGEGFESDDKFEKWSFRKFTGKLTVDSSVTETPDTTATESKPDTQKTKSSSDKKSTPKTSAKTTTTSADKVTPDRKLVPGKSIRKSTSQREQTVE